MVQLSIIVRNHVQSLSVGKYYSTSQIMEQLGTMRPAALQCYSQSCWPHGSQPFHDFHWYNSCGTEKCPLAVNGSCQQEWPWGVPVDVFWEWLVTKEPAALCE